MARFVVVSIETVRHKISSFAVAFLPHQLTQCLDEEKEEKDSAREERSDTERVRPAFVEIDGLANLDQSLA